MAVSFIRRLSVMAGIVFFSTNGAAFQHPIERPAGVSELSTKAPLLAVTVAGDRLVAVGVRGHIVTSDDGGNTWKQRVVPVSTDLVAVSFPTANDGWAVGHGGVVLHTSDGGNTWTKQLSGRDSSEIALRHYEPLARTSGDEIAKVLEQEKLLESDIGTPSFLDVHFETDSVGYIVGTFNRIFRTQDGGRTWEPWMDRVDNPRWLNFYGVAYSGGSWYLAGELGTVWRMGATKQRFVAVPTPYQGTLFGVAAARDGRLMVYGMRGTFFISADKGQTWSKSTTGAAAGITGVTQLSDGRIVLASQAGGYMVGDDSGKEFSARKSADNMSNFGVVAVAGNRLVFVGMQGVRVEPLH